jgi:ferredoxin--NADP+ reductase
MPHIAIIGSGPAGYTAEAAQKQGDAAHIDIFDHACALWPDPQRRCPDHQSVKGVSRRYEAVALSDNVRSFATARWMSVEDLLGLYDAVVLAGAPRIASWTCRAPIWAMSSGRRHWSGGTMGIPIAGLAPDLSGGHAVVIGNGNVALDVARILAKTQDEFAGSDIVAHARGAAGSKMTGVTILGRRGPHQIAMTPKELGELGHLSRAMPHVAAADLPGGEDAALEPGLRKAVQLLRGFEGQAAQGEEFPIDFVFYAAPMRWSARMVRAIEVERTQLVDGKAVGTGEVSRHPRRSGGQLHRLPDAPIPGVPYDEARGRFANEEGRILPGLTAWAGRGGAFGHDRHQPARRLRHCRTHRPGHRHGGKRQAGPPRFRCSGGGAGLDIVTFRDWKKIDAAEIARAREAPREIRRWAP